MGKQQIVSYDEMLSVDRISLFSVCSLINGEELVIRWDGDTPFQDATVNTPTISNRTSTLIMAQPLPPLRFVAEPRSSYRARYMCEGRPARNRAQRFVRAQENPDKYVYPTVEIPIEWTSQLPKPAYIRLTHVTCPNEQVDIKCVHPYPIATEDVNVIQDRATNSLFFRISDEELVSGRKSFQFTLYKLTQYQLRTYGSLQILNSSEKDDKRFEDPTDPRRIIDTYQLAQSQIVCSIATFENNQQLPLIYDVSSVYSQIMIAAAAATNDDHVSVRCSPQRGDANGGDEILMVIPRVDKRKAFTVRFDHPSVDPRSTVNMIFVDTKTILFYSPPCPVILTRENPSYIVPIVVTQNDVELARINFCYQSMDTCLNCHTNKRTFADLTESDDLTLSDITVEPIDNPELDFAQAQNYPNAKRRMQTSAVDQFEVLENAIEQGNIDLALQLINQRKHFLEQQNSRGETPLLMAARLNRERLVLAILKDQLNLSVQVDRQGNNILHLLANISENRAEKTIEAIFTLLEGPLKDRLILQLNQSQEKPVDIARNRGHQEYIEFFNHPATFLNFNLQ